MILKLNKIGLIVLAFNLLTFIQVNAQQDPQYTHYMYNTMSVNPAYAGQRDVLNITGLYRTQWVGIDGAPKTQTLGVHSPLRNERIGLGLSIINDALGPARETYVNANFSYTLPIDSDNIDKKLSFGISGGFHLLETDWSKGRYQNPDIAFNENVNLFSPTIGLGLYMHSSNWYIGLSAPNLLTTEHYDDFQESLATERIHLYLIGGFVFNLSDSVKFKPALLAKGVEGAPIAVDVSANFLFNDKFTLGAAYRRNAAISALLGFQISQDLMIGYAYDHDTTELSNYDFGSHEIFLRFEIAKKQRLKTPRFF